MELNTENLELIGDADNAAPNRRAHTRLSLYYAPDRATGKAFLSRVQAFYDGEETKSFHVHLGDLDRALAYFKPSALTDRIKVLADDWWDLNQPRYDSDMNEQDLPATFGCGSHRLVEVMAWLYQGEAGDLVEKMAHDFHILPETLRSTIDDETKGRRLPGWAKAFVAAMRYFDRDLWLKQRS